MRCSATLRRLPALILLCGCSGPPLAQPVRPPESATTLPAPASGNQRLDPVSGCPGDYDRLTRMISCVNPDRRQCDYPQGRCLCVPDPQAPEQGVWSCIHPACPYDEPVLGARCDAPADVRCGYAQSRGVACVSGVWERR